jgi:hypothetical protein
LSSVLAGRCYLESHEHALRYQASYTSSFIIPVPCFSLLVLVSLQSDGRPTYSKHLSHPRLRHPQVAPDLRSLAAIDPSRLLHMEHTPISQRSQSGCSYSSGVAPPAKGSDLAQWQRAVRPRQRPRPSISKPHMPKIKPLSPLFRITSAINNCYMYTTLALLFPPSPISAKHYLL